MSEPHYLELAREIAQRCSQLDRPMLFGISGGVASGKSTAAKVLGDHLAAEGLTARILPTDSFLLPNAELAERGLLMRKGFPESFDADEIGACLQRIAEGDLPVGVPVYSHVTYDRVPGDRRVLEPADVFVVEGVNALLDPAAGRMDMSVYLDAPEEVMVTWFVDRFLRMCEEAEGRESFYGIFSEMTSEQRRAAAETTWRAINGVNLAEHILPSRKNATFVLEKEPDHSVRSLVRQA